MQWDFNASLFIAPYLDSARVPLDFERSLSYRRNDILVPKGSCNLNELGKRREALKVMFVLRCVL